MFAIFFFIGNKLFCISHGGGRRCNFPDCLTSARHGSHFCRYHKEFSEGDIAASAGDNTPTGSAAGDNTPSSETANAPATLTPESGPSSSIKQQEIVPKAKEKPEAGAEEITAQALVNLATNK